MAQCDANDLIAQACESGFTCRNEPELLALLNQLLCNYAASGGGGGSDALTAFTILNPAAVLPFTFTATRRSRVEISYSLAAVGAGVASLSVARTGAPTVSLTSGSSGITTRFMATFSLGPGDTITITDTSTPVATPTLDFVVIYVE